MCQKIIKLSLEDLADHTVFNWYITCTGYFSLQFEADRRAFIITINSFGTELTKEDRAKLYPRCGDLYPYGLQLLAKADDYDQVRQVADIYGVNREKMNV